MCLAAVAWARGTVNFNNNVVFMTAGDRLVYASTATPLVGTNYVAQLCYGTQSTARDSFVPVASPPARFREPTTSVPGTRVGGTRTLERVTVGQTATLQVRHWNLSLFPT